MIRRLRSELILVTIATAPTAIVSIASPAQNMLNHLGEAAFRRPRAGPSRSPAALHHGRYARFEAFLHKAGLGPDIFPVNRLAIHTGGTE